MTKSKSLLQQVIERCSEEATAKNVSVYHHAAFATFECPPEPPKTHREFEDIAVEFVRHQFRAGQRVEHGPPLARETALGKAKTILKDWEGSFTKATDSTQGGLHGVLDELAKALQEEQEQMWWDLELDRIIGPLDTRAQMQIAQEILDEFGHYLPSQIRATPVGILAANYKGIVRIVMQGIAHIRRPIRGWDPAQVG